MKIEVESRVMLLQAKESLGLLESTRGKEDSFLGGFSENVTQLTPRVGTSGLQNCVAMNFWFKSSSLWYFGKITLQNEYIR